MSSRSRENRRAAEADQRRYELALALGASFFSGEGGGVFSLEDDPDWNRPFAREQEQARQERLRTQQALKGEG